MALTIKEQMAQNSAAWHTSDAATKKKLEAANQVLGKSIGSSYTANTGTWTHAPEAVQPEVQPVVPNGVIPPVVPNGVIPPVEDYYSSQMWAQAQAEAIAIVESEKAAQLRTRSAIETNNAHITQVNQQTDAQLQQAYITAQQAKINAPQSLAAMGYSGGAAESSIMGLDTNYQNNRNELETSRNTSLDSIRQNANTIQATGNAELADLASQYYSQMASAQERAQQNAQAQANWQANFDAQQQATERSNYSDTARAYYSDYMAQINKLQGDNDTTNDWQIQYLQAAREQKKAQQTEQYSAVLSQYKAGELTLAEANYLLKKYGLPTI